MKKFEIKTDSFQIPFGKGKESIHAMTAAEVFSTYFGSVDNDPKSHGIYDSLDDARKAFKRFENYGSTYPEAGNVFWLLRGDLAWIEENEYDEDGEFISGGDVWEYSAQGYSHDE